MRTVARRAAAAAAIALGMSAWTPYGVAAALAAAEPVDLGGQPVEASTDPGAPTALGPGLWSTTLGSDPVHFSYERQIEDSTVHVGVIGAPPGPDGDGISLASFVPPPAGETDDVDCGTDDVSTDSSAPYGVLGGHVVVGDEEGDTGDTCRSGATVEVTVTRSTGNSDDLPIAVKVVEEAPVADPGAPLPEGEELQPDVPEPVDPTSGPAGAASFDDAPLIEDALGGAVTIDAPVREGQELVWRVPLDWGDQLIARADLPALTEDEHEQLGYSTSYVKLAIIQPSRELSALSGDEYSYGYYGPERARLIVATYPLRYANRTVSDIPPLLPGDQWVSVTAAEAPEERDPVEIPVRLTLEVTSSDAAAPTYKGAVLAQGGGAGPEDYRPETPYLVGDGEFSAVASGNPFTPERDDGSWWGARRFAGLGLGLASLACCAVGAVWLARARRG